MSEPTADMFQFPFLYDLMLMLLSNGKIIELLSIYISILTVSLPKSNPLSRLGRFLLNNKMMFMDDDITDDEVNYVKRICLSIIETKSITELHLSRVICEFTWPKPTKNHDKSSVGYFSSLHECLGLIDVNGKIIEILKSTNVVMKQTILIELGTIKNRVIQDILEQRVSLDKLRYDKSQNRLIDDQENFNNQYMGYEVIFNFIKDNFDMNRAVILQFHPLLRSFIMNSEKNELRKFVLLLSGLNLRFATVILV
jgi:flagellar biosynthesis/type III secretory pathway chaperone